MPVGNEGLDQLDRQRPDVSLHGHDFITAKVAIEDLAIGRVLGRIKHGRQTVPFRTH